MRSEKDPRILKLTLTERKAQQTLLPFSFVQCQLQDVTHFDSFKWQQVRLAGSLCVSLTSSIRTQLYFGKDPVHHGSPYGHMVCKCWHPPKCKTRKVKPTKLPCGRLPIKTSFSKQNFQFVNIFIHIVVGN